MAIAKPETQVHPLSSPAADAELIAIGREAAALIELHRPMEVRFWALPGLSEKEDQPHDAELNALGDAMLSINDRLDVLVDQAIDLPATTWEGMAAKAHLIRHEMHIDCATRGVMDLAGLDAHEQLTWALLHDLLAVRS